MGVPATHPVSPSVSAHFASTTIPTLNKDVVDANIVIFGETGVGKSSIVNLIAGQKLARTSNDAVGCTFQHQRHVVTLNGKLCALWDTTGLDEGSEGTVPADIAEENLRTLIQNLSNSGGIHLIVYCIRPGRLTKALQRNYDLFYVTVCRRKVPVALVVTGLEHQEGNMESWWDDNEADLRQYKLWFDAHECITTLNTDDNVIQKRRADSQKQLRELVLRYSGYSAWKAEPSFVSWVLPQFGNIFRRTISARRTGSGEILRRVAVCDMSPNSDAYVEKRIELIDGHQYEFFQLDKHVLRSHWSSRRVVAKDLGFDAGALVFYSSDLGETVIQPREIDLLKSFYEIAGGQKCPVIVVLRGCKEERTVEACRDAIGKDIQVYLTTLSHEKVVDIIDRLYIERSDVGPSTLHTAFVFAKRWIVAAVDRFESAAGCLRRRRRHS